MGIAEIFIILKGSISLVPGIFSVIEKIKNSGNEPDLINLIDTFKNDTIQSSEGIRIKMNEIRRILSDNNFDLTKRIGEHQEAYSRLNLLKNFTLSRATKKLREIQDNLTASVEEIGRVLMCKGQFNDMDEFDQFVRMLTRDLNSIEEKPIKDVFDAYEKILSELEGKLRRC